MQYAEQIPWVNIYRVEQTSEGALGVLCFQKKMFCCTLEPDCNDLYRSQIPEGSYLCHRYSSDKYPNTFEISVPKHTKVLFHWGNVEKDTTMCVLLGMYPGYLMGNRAVMRSKSAFDGFIALTTPYKYLKLIVKNVWSESEGTSP